MFLGETAGSPKTLAPVVVESEFATRNFAGSWALVEPPWPHHGAAPAKGCTDRLVVPKLAGSEDPLWEMVLKFMSEAVSVSDRLRNENY